MCKVCVAYIHEAEGACADDNLHDGKDLDTAAADAGAPRTFFCPVRRPFLIWYYLPCLAWQILVQQALLAAGRLQQESCARLL